MYSIARVVHPSLGGWSDITLFTKFQGLAEKRHLLAKPTYDTLRVESKVLDTKSYSVGPSVW